MTDHNDAHQLVSPRLYVTVWAVLVILTGVTVSVSFLDMQHFTVFTALLIAAAKSTLVVLYFMHLRYDHPFNGLILVAGLGFLALFLGLVLLDTFQYQPDISNW